MTEYLPEVSVIVPVFNSERTIEALVHSLLALDYPKDKLEIILVDNASTDNTRPALAAFGDRIRILVEPKQGRSAARNLGIRAARFDVIAFTDADCVVDSGWLRELIVPLRDPRVGISGGKIRAIQPCNRIQEFGERLRDHHAAINIYQPPYVDTANWASPKRVLLDAGGFDETLQRCVDVDLAYRIFQRGDRLVYCEGAVVFHHNRASLRSLFKEGFQHGFHSIRVIEKHRNFLRGFGHRRVHLEQYRTLGRNIIRLVRKKGDTNLICEVVFNSGKRAGKIAGSLRFGAVDL